MEQGSRQLFRPALQRLPSDWGARFLLLYVAALLGYALWKLFAPEVTVAFTAARVALFQVVCAAAFSFGLRASSAPGLSPNVRQAWRWFTASLLSLWVADLIWLYYEFILVSDPYPSVADLFYLLFYPLMFVGLIALSRSGRVVPNRTSYWLDMATVMVGGWILVWHVLFSPVVSETPPDLWTTALSVIYPLTDLVLLYGAAAVLLGQPPAESVKAVRLIAVGLLIWVADDLIFGYLNLRGIYQSGGWADLPYLMAHLIFAWGATVQVASGGRSVQRPKKGEGEGRPAAAYLPYGVVTAAYGLLIIGYLVDEAPSRGLLISAIILTVVVIYRQIFFIRENQQLLRETEYLATQLNRSMARFRSLVQHSSDVITIIDQHGVLTYQSPAITRIFGYSPGELIGTPLGTWLHPDDRAAGEAFLDRALHGDDADRVMEWRLRHRNGGWRQAESTVSRMPAETGTTGLVLNTRDISDRKALESELRFQAYHDGLTGLANRTLFRQRVEQGISSSEQGGGQVAILFLDLDGFKAVNDSLGHDAGDRLLRVVGERLRAACQSGETVARLGGDEFAILLVGTTVAAAMETAEMVIRYLSLPIELMGRRVTIAASVGIALHEEAKTPADTLLRNADIAMYKAKRLGKGAYELFRPEMHQEAMARLELELDLRRAIDEQEFTLYYQPVLALRTGEVTGLEALIRWEHPQQGHLSPGHFIPAAEAMGLMPKIGAWVLRNACHQARQWQLAGFPHLTMSVNVSAQQMLSADFVESVADALLSGGLAAEHLILEITESSFVSGKALVLQRLEQLRAMGVRVAIDDFGTGYSSLEYLRTFPVDFVKIDRSFIKGMGTPRDAALTRAVIEMARALQIRTVAEGVEQATQLEQLALLECDHWQGFFFAKPMPVGDVERLLRQQETGGTGRSI